MNIGEFNRVNKNGNVKSKLLLFAVLLFVYVLLFEFILPDNKVLPRPSLLIDTFTSIWSIYHLLQAFAVTTTVIYISLAIGYLITMLRARFIIMASYELPDSVESLKLFKYFPPLFVLLLFIFWFNNSIYAEFIFALVVTAFMLSVKLFSEAKNVKQEYILIGTNLGLPQHKIHSQIIWKAVEPKVFKSMLNIHYLLWTLVLVYEFIANIGGFGGVYHTALLYNDYSTFICVAILISLLMWFGNSVLSLIYNKYFAWEQ